MSVSAELMLWADESYPPTRETLQILARRVEQMERQIEQAKPTPVEEQC